MQKFFAGFEKAAQTNTLSHLNMNTSGTNSLKRAFSGLLGGSKPAATPPPPPPPPKKTVWGGGAFGKGG